MSDQLISHRWICDTFPLSSLVESLLIRTRIPVPSVFIAPEDILNGDWLKVRDNKDCYAGIAPSEKDIYGWIRWRNGDGLILKVAHSC
jgi:hypothetical protein